MAASRSHLPTGCCSVYREEGIIPNSEPHKPTYPSPNVSIFNFLHVSRLLLAIVDDLDRRIQWLEEDQQLAHEHQLEQLRKIGVAVDKYGVDSREFQASVTASIATLRGTIDDLRKALADAGVGADLSDIDDAINTLDHQVSEDLPSFSMPNITDPPVPPAANGVPIVNNDTSTNPATPDTSGPPSGDSPPPVGSTPDVPAPAVNTGAVTLPVDAEGTVAPDSPLTAPATVDAASNEVAPAPASEPPPVSVDEPAPAVDTTAGADTTLASE